MKKKSNSAIFFILFIASVAIVIILCVMNAKQEVDEFQEMQQTIAVEESTAAEQTSEAVNAFRQQTDAQYTDF